MKYYVYSFIWRNKTSSSWNAGTGSHACDSVVGLFEHAAQQPEQWAITSYAEVTKEEYESSVARGILG
jgi:hypothetical protein